MHRTTYRAPGRHAAPAVEPAAAEPAAAESAAAEPAAAESAAAESVAAQPTAPEPAAAATLRSRRTNARRAKPDRRPVFTVAIACFSMLPVFLIAPAANAAEPDGLGPSTSLAPGPTAAQVLAAGASVAGATADRDGYTVNKPSEATVAPGSSTNKDWATLVLVDGGWPTSDNNVTVILQWMDSENSPQSWWLRNNPLNNGYGSGGGAGFGSYPELVTAARDAAANLSTNSVYSAIIADFAADAPVATTVSAIEASPWASSHYGYGSIWHAVDVPIVAADSSAW